MEACLAHDEHVKRLLGHSASQHLQQVRLVLWSDYTETEVQAVAMQLRLLEQTLDTLAEFVQGPCAENQLVLARSCVCENAMPLLDFLLALTFHLDLWEWCTWEVVQYLVKPATEGEGRCRFADLEGVRPFAGAATVFMSHCWGGRWGDLVAAACAGADTNRTVWIDVFAVRQWPGNGADLDFRGVLAGCTAAESG